MIRFNLKFIKSPLPKVHGPVANICIGDYSTKEGEISITPDCLSYVEIEEQIGLLKKELDEIKKEAKRQFASAGKSHY
jgi:uncharacterized small protein (DUF1192 family)